jgi:putative transposase
MIDRGHKLPLTRQAAVLGVSRGSLFYSACPVPASELAIMRRRRAAPRLSVSRQSDAA